MPARTEELQRRLAALGFDAGPFDGLYGDLTEEGVFDALDRYAPAIETSSGLIPAEWMPLCEVQRVICHWTAGAYKANTTDLNYYHILIEDTGELRRGVYSIKDNVYTGDGKYAPHTKNCNTGSIGVSLCCMTGAVESPFDAGACPMLEAQWDTLTTCVAELCDAYTIPVMIGTVLSHAEVQGTLGIAQSGKWDYSVLPFDPSFPKGAKAVGDRLRAEVSAKL
jgi:hypothetical protein